MVKSYWFKTHVFNFSFIKKMKCALLCCLWSLQLSFLKSKILMFKKDWNWILFDDATYLSKDISSLEALTLPHKDDQCFSLSYFTFSFNMILAGEEKGAHQSKRDGSLHFTLYGKDSSLGEGTIEPIGCDICKLLHSFQGSIWNHIKDGVLHNDCFTAHLLAHQFICLHASFLAMWAFIPVIVWLIMLQLYHIYYCSWGMLAFGIVHYCSLISFSMVPYVCLYHFLYSHPVFHACSVCSLSCVLGIWTLDALFLSQLAHN